MDVFVLCLQISATGCASFTLNTSVFFNSKNERFLKEQLTVKVNVTEEGTGDRSKQNSHPSRTSKKYIYVNININSNIKQLH